MCNPPFYSSQKEANAVSNRKVKNLNRNREKKGHAPMKKGAHSNFGGVKAELWCPGGELAFIKKMINESTLVQAQCRWFTTLVSNKSNLDELKNDLKNHLNIDIRIIEMHQGSKISHLLAWTFK